jgi:PAS domain S-box-containing protein
MRSVQASQSAELFERLFENSPVATALSRLEDGVVVLVNDRFVALTGYDREELLGQTGAALRVWARPGDRSAFLAQLSAQGSVAAFVHPIQTKTGQRVQVVASACLLDIHGTQHVLGQLVFLHDLDRAHTDLREREAQLRLAERAARFGLWDFDVATQRIEWSAGLKLLCGLSDNGFDGTFDGFVALIHPDDRERFLEQRRPLVDRGQSVELDYRIRRADGGGERWLRTRATPRLGPAGNVVGTHGLVFDVAQEKEREQLLMLQSQIMANMAEGVCLVSAKSDNIVFTNTRFERMLGYSNGELRGRHVSVVNAEDGRDPGAVAEAIIGEMRRAGLWRGEVRNRRKDGGELLCRVSISAFDHAEYGLVWVAVHNDVTEAHEAQQARDVAYAELERLSANLRESIERERGAIARDVHDQLGSVLTAMRMRLEALAKKKEWADAEEWRGALLVVAGMAQSAQVAARTICDRLRPPMLDDLGLAETCRWSVQEWSRGCGIRARIRLREPVRTTGPDVATDLYRALQEMLTNVARHAGASLVQVRLLSSAHGVRLHVLDNGRGFDAQRRERRGFGLSSLNERAMRHDGTLRVRSGPHGTSIAISLPLRKPS